MQLVNKGGRKATMGDHAVVPSLLQNANLEGTASGGYQ